MNKIKLLITSLVLIPAQLLMGDLNLHTSQSSINGDSITAFENYDILGPNIFASMQVSGVWLSAVPIANPLTYPIQPKTAINSLGEVIVIWIGNDITTFNPSLYASVYSSGIWITTLLTVPVLEFVIGNHQVKLAENSSVVVTWASYMLLSNTNEARGIYSATYPSLGIWPAASTLP